MRGLGERGIESVERETKLVFCVVFPQTKVPRVSGFRVRIRILFIQNFRKSLYSVDVHLPAADLFPSMEEFCVSVLYGPSAAHSAPVRLLSGPCLLPC